MKLVMARRDKSFLRILEYKDRLCNDIEAFKFLGYNVSMSSTSTSLPQGLQATNYELSTRVEVGPGCYRWDLPGENGVRSWVVEIQPGAQWPHVDMHDETGEVVFVVSGELIEGSERYGTGTYVLFGPLSRHQPRSERGVTLFGFNLAPSSSGEPER